MIRARGSDAERAEMLPIATAGVGDLRAAVAFALLVPVEAGIPIPPPADLVMFAVGERVAAGAFPLWLGGAGLEAVAAVGMVFRLSRRRTRRVGDGASTAAMQACTEVAYPACLTLAVIAERATARTPRRFALAARRDGA